MRSDFTGVLEIPALFSYNTVWKNRYPTRQRCAQTCSAEDEPEGQVNPAQPQVLLSEWMAPLVYLGARRYPSPQKAEYANPSCSGRQVSSGDPMCGGYLGSVR